MVELVITEKPNASKRIADALADDKPEKMSEKGVPYYLLKHKGKKIIVGCAVGHLFGLTEKKKSKGFKYPVFDVEWAPTYEISKSAEFSKKYLIMLKKLAKDADSFVVATDYDVEGEVIGLNIVRFACGQKDAMRMKFSTLTRPDLIEAYDSRSRSLDWPQAEAGETRHFLDYFYGINLSRALTAAIKKAGMFKILSTGRVQGPALKICVDREREISKFKPVPFWQVELDAEHKNGSIHALHVEDKFWEKNKVDVVMGRVKDAKSAVVSAVAANKYKQKPPVPFDLTSLQTESYRCFGLNPKRTLEVAQNLYTQGIISYPRTSSQQLTDKIGFKKILQALSKQNSYKDLAGGLLRKPTLVPNNGSKVDPAHPAIYPTGIAPKKLDERGAKVYDIIVKRFFSVFGDPAVRERVKITLDVNGELFAAQGTRTVEPNWHVFYAPYVKLEEVELPAVREKDVAKVKKIGLKEDETKPPKRFTPSSLIRALEKEGLGTKATRAEIVDTLAKRQYITGESIAVTELGMHIIKILEKYCDRIIDPELTRHFEEYMDNIRDGQSNREKVLAEAKDILTEILSEFRSKEKVIGEGLVETFSETRAAMTTVGKCPVCGGQLVIKRGKFGRFIACDKYPECETTFKLPAAGMVEVTEEVCAECKHPMIKMIRKGKRPQVVCINPECPGKRVEKDLSGEPCPKCKEGRLVIRKSVYGHFFACDRFPKCRYIQRSVPKYGAVQKEKVAKTSAIKKAVKKTAKKRAAKKK